MTLVLRQSNEAVVLQVSDNGRGFNVTEPAARNDAHSGLGLISMRERTELLGGDFAVGSESGHGTVVTVTIPLHVAARNEENARYHR